MWEYLSWIVKYKNSTLIVRNEKFNQKQVFFPEG